MSEARKLSQEWVLLHVVSERTGKNDRGGDDESMRGGTGPGALGWYGTHSLMRMKTECTS